MTALAAYAAHEAEIAIQRATAIRALMATGATHAEACAAVDEETRRAFDLELARCLDRWDHLVETLRPGIERALRQIAEIGAQLAESFRQTLGGGVTQADVVLHAPGRPADEQDHVRALIAHRRRGHHAGPPARRMDGRRAA